MFQCAKISRSIPVDGMLRAIHSISWILQIDWLHEMHFSLRCSLCYRGNLIPMTQRRNYIMLPEITFEVNYMTRCVSWAIQYSQYRRCHRSCHVVVCCSRCMPSFASNWCHVIQPKLSSLQFRDVTLSSNPISNGNDVSFCVERAIYDDVYSGKRSFLIHQIRRSLMKTNHCHHMILISIPTTMIMMKMKMKTTIRMMMMMTMTMNQLWLFYSKAIEIKTYFKYVFASNFDSLF